MLPAAGAGAADPHHRPGRLLAAARLQNTLAAWVDGLGSWTVALALLVLGGLGIAVALRRRRGRSATPAE
ncbi:hypothetical protein [Planomonospora parontospora]|uniref:hypothetical protein n=1 Tax=Planomonospora parontospora TaxID=58119 RepID=UPI0016711BAB|nr:hypothetical protein [Planomonospora parontospora]